MKNLTEINLEKSRSGVYQDTSENRRLHRVGQRYGEPKKEEISSESRKSDLDELKRDMLQAEADLRAHNRRRSLYASYTRGEENWSRTQAKLEQKLDTLQQEYKRRFAEVNRKPEEKKPNKVKIEGKTFRVEDGKIVASMFDNQSRIRKIMKFAAENGYKVAWEESKTVQKPEQKKPSLATNLSVKDYDGVKNGGHVMFVDKKKGGAFNTVTRVGGQWMSETPDGKKKVISSQELYDLVQKYDNKDGYGINANLRFSGPLERDLKKETKKTDDTVKQGGESFTRVNLSDIPNAHKVNLKKYLSAKRKAAVDEAWSKAGFDNVTKERAGVFQEGYNKLREQFNNNFDSMSKAERAELLYKILKMKNAIERK